MISLILSNTHFSWFSQPFTPGLSRFRIMLQVATGNVFLYARHDVKKIDFIRVGFDLIGKCVPSFSVYYTQTVFFLNSLFLGYNRIDAEELEIVISTATDE